LTELPLPISLTHNGDDAPQNYEGMLPELAGHSCS